MQWRSTSGSSARARSNSSGPSGGGARTSRGSCPLRYPDALARRRFFVDEIRAGEAVLSGDHAQHLRKVLRVQTGQQFEISDQSSVYLAEVTGFGKDQVRFRVLREEAQPPLPVRAVLLLSLVKFDHFEWAIEKATELGVERILPVVAERSEHGLEKAAAKRLERWQRIALESSQQSRRLQVPDIGLPAPLESALQIPARVRLFLNELEGTPLLNALPPEDSRAPSDEVAVLIGPEGGWTTEERAQAVEGGWTAVSLGPLILRAETAAAASLALVTNAWLARHK
jgi:16S rRNA (uracil1498-N3)-methyltransferase